MEFLVYELTAKALHLGERAKGNVFKPCLRTIPFSAISGALNHYFGAWRGKTEEPSGIKAVGYLDGAAGHNRIELMTYAPRDRVSSVSKIPLQVEFLADVRATVLVVANDAAESLAKRFQIALGGMRSHGFGRAELQFRERRAAGSPRLGSLRVRLPEGEAKSFGIVKVERAVYGYLFKPTPGTHTGAYVLSLFEGSRVVGPDFLLEPRGEQRWTM